MRQQNTCISLPQSTGSLITNAALTLSEKTSYLFAKSEEFFGKIEADFVFQFLYWATGSMSWKYEAYSSSERTFLHEHKNNKLKLQILTWKKHKKTDRSYVPYLKPYSDITTAGSPFPVATMSSFSNLTKKKKNQQQQIEE